MENKNDKIVTNVKENEKAGSKRFKNILPKVLSLLFAFALWFYVVSVESPIKEKTFDSIAILVEQSQSSDLSPFSGDYDVKVTVKGKRSLINQLSEEDISAVADVSNITKAGDYDVDVKIILPSGITLVEQGVKVIPVSLDVKTQIEKEINVIPLNYSQSSDCEPIDEKLIEKDFSTVRITGPKKLLDTIDQARVYYDHGDQKFDSSVSGRGNIALYKADGKQLSDSERRNLELSTEFVDFTIPVFMTKTLLLTADIGSGYLNSENCTVNISPSSVTVKGPAQTLRNTDSWSIYTVNEGTIPNDTVNLSLIGKLPEDAELVDTTGDIAKITVQLSDLKTDTIKVSNFEIKNPDDLDYKLSDDSINIKVEGVSAAVKAITADDITLVVDFTQIKSKSAPVTVVYSSKFANSMIPVPAGSYSIGVE
ncbi:MAG: hypothetical protein IKU52_08890 [Clostridia bacterium]|nr:hypothetical protein [Clostridia bacterium]